MENGPSKKLKKLFKLFWTNSYIILLWFIIKKKFLYTQDNLAFQLKYE